MMFLNLSIGKYRNYLFLITGILLAIIAGWMTANFGFAIPAVLLAVSLFIPLLISIFVRPQFGLFAFIVYSFLYTAFSRHLVNAPFIYGIEVILLLTWITVIVQNSKYNWSLINRDLVILGLAWFSLTVLQLANPEAGSFLGWISDARYSFLWVLCVPLCFLLFRKQESLNIFLVLIIACSFLAALYGIIQQHVGLLPADKLFLEEGGAKTHLIGGQLRIFSLYTDAGQFGASMAQFAVITLTLALAPFRAWKRVLFFAAGIVFTYAMLISGTRGALFVFLIGFLMALIIYKNFRVFIIGLFIIVGSVVFLKYTTLLQSSAEVRRMRTALNPEDASFNVRLENQALFREYLRDKPFGGGIGSVGYAGYTYNKGTYLSTIPPDSYWVKVWAMYGIIGLVIWFGIMFYIIGKSSAIVWRIRDNRLRFKLGALAAGATGIFISSYGNEVMNNMPSAMILYISWTLIFIHSSNNKRKPLSNR